jgi:hypothetical protein
MPFKISEFKSNLTGGGARSSLFNVNLSFPTSLSIGDINKYKFLISASSIPASTLGTYDIFYHGKSLKVASDRTFESWDTTIINDEDFAIRKSLEKWINRISKPDLNTRDTTMVGTTTGKEGTNADYKSDLNVTQFSKNGTILKQYKFIGAFPTSISSIPLSWESSAIETYTCNWTYDYWTTIEQGTGNDENLNDQGLADI